jgi:hypothetical protein
VTCDPHRFLDAITDATAIVEVLLPFTVNYDRGEKFRSVRCRLTLESLYERVEFEE